MRSFPALLKTLPEEKRKVSVCYLLTKIQINKHADKSTQDHTHAIAFPGNVRESDLIIKHFVQYLILLGNCLRSTLLTSFLIVLTGNMNKTALENVNRTNLPNRSVFTLHLGSILGMFAMKVHIKHPWYFNRFTFSHKSINLTGLTANQFCERFL